ncbi:hypothetical protein ACIOFR_41835, partial [Kitasatospora sp. NPDC088346]
APSRNSASYVRRFPTLNSLSGHDSTLRGEAHDYLDDYRKVFGDAGDELWHLERGRGAIHISDNGCGMTGWLIVVGPHRGELRDRDCAVNPPFEPYVDAKGNRHTFRTWYLEWLEQRDDQELVTLARPTHSVLLNPSPQRNCTLLRYGPAPSESGATAVCGRPWP